MFRRDIIVECGGFSGTFRESGTFRTSVGSDSINESSAQARTDADVDDPDVTSFSDMSTIHGDNTDRTRINRKSSSCSSSIDNNDSRPDPDERSVKCDSASEDCSEIDLIEDYALWKRILLR